MGDLCSGFLLADDSLPERRPRQRAEISGHLRAEYCDAYEARGKDQVKALDRLREFLGCGVKSSDVEEARNEDACRTLLKQLHDADISYNKAADNMAFTPQRR